MISIWAGMAAIMLAVLTVLAVLKPAAFWVAMAFILAVLATLVFLIEPPLGEWLRWWRAQDTLEEDEG